MPLSGRPVVPEMIFSYASLNCGMNASVRAVCIKGHEVGEARNWLIEQALANNSEFTFFLDEDVTPPPHAVRQMLFHMRHNPNMAAISGIVCHKAHPTSPMIFRGNGVGPHWDWKVGELFQISGAGCGCLLIRNDVFKQMEKPWFLTKDNNSAILDGINHLEQFTEDLYFFENLEKLKNPKTDQPWEVWADGGVLCEHWDTATGKYFMLPPNSYPMQHDVVAHGTKKILDIGAGECPYSTNEGTVVTVDGREEVNPDYRCDVRVLPFGTGAFDIVFSSHTLEHFMRDEWDSVLDEWCRVLKADGEFRLIVPNVEWAADQIKQGINEQNKEHVYNVLYGAQSYDLNRHGMGFTPQIVREAFEKRGFKKVDIIIEGYNITARAYRKVEVVPVKRKQLAAAAKPKVKIKTAKKK